MFYIASESMKLAINLYFYKTINKANCVFKILFFIVSFISVKVSAQAIKVEIQKTSTGYQLFRNQKPYFVIGAGGQTQLDLVVKLGGNSIRTWGLENAQEILDEAHKKGLTVMLGFWIQHERHGFDYDNEIKVNKQIEYFKKAIDQFKNHPALLLWGIGNEVDLFYTNTKVWNTIQEIAKYAHQVDPNHPTTTVTAGLDSTEVQHVLRTCKDIDIYSVNTYGDIANVPQNIHKFGWQGPFMITEWGPNGHWESPVTKWGAAIEQSSKEKADVYQKRYAEYIEKYQHHCLGSYVFLWGQKQEYTTTWYGLFSKEGYETQAIDALKIAWSKRNPDTPTPSIDTFLINNIACTQNLEIMANSSNNKAFIQPKLITYSSEKTDPNNLHISWKILAESTDKKAGGDTEKEADELKIKYKKIGQNEIAFTAPSDSGAYRLFVTIRYENKIAYANYPFYVIPNPAKGNGKKIWIKKWEMKSFDE